MITSPEWKRPLRDGRLLRLVPDRELKVCAVQLHIKEKFLWAPLSKTKEKLT